MHVNKNLKKNLKKYNFNNYKSLKNNNCKKEKYKKRKEKNKY